MEDVQYILPVEPSCVTGLLPCEQQVFDVHPKRLCTSNPTQCFKAVSFRAELLRRMGGWSLPTLPTALALPNLPEIIPSIKGDQRCPFDPSSYDKVLAVRIDEIVGFGDAQRSDLSTWRKRRGVPDDVLLLLHQESKDDRLMDVVFRIIEDDERLRLLKKLGRIAVIATAPSIYTKPSTQCRQQQLTHLSLAVRAYCRLQEAGIPSILNLGWATQGDLDRISVMLRDAASRVGVIAVNMQSGGKVDDHVLREIVALEASCGQTYKWILIGAVSKRFMHKAERYLPRSRRIHVSAQLREKSVQGRNLRNERVDGTASDVLKLNTETVYANMRDAQIAYATQARRVG